MWEQCTLVQSQFCSLVPDFHTKYSLPLLLIRCLHLVEGVSEMLAVSSSAMAVDFRLRKHIILSKFIPN